MEHSFLKEASNILYMYMKQRDEIVIVDYDHDNSIFFCWNFYLSTLHNTLKDINFFVTRVYCDLVVVDMCNCINAWIGSNIIEFFFFLYSNK